MDPITMAITAALGKLGGDVVKDAYQALKAALQQKFGVDSDLVEAVNKLEKKPDSKARKAVVQEEVETVKADQDAELVKIAEALLETLKESSEGPVNITQDIDIINLIVGQTSPAGDLPAQLAALQQALPHLDPTRKGVTQAMIGQLKQAIADLPGHEHTYRERIKARYAEDAPYYIPLAGATTEAISLEVKAKTPRSARRRRQRAQVEYHEWIQAEQEIRRVKLKDLREGADKYDCIILLGEPGSGKTTALENLAYQFADEEDTLPLPLRLSEFGLGMSVEDFIIQVWGGPEQAGYWGTPELAANLDGYLEDGKLFILFDALNEMPREGSKERARVLRQFMNRWSQAGNRFMVTCRVLDYEEELSGLRRIEVQPLSNEQIETFLQKELPEDWSAVWQTLANEQDEQRRLLEMARNPYILTMMIDVFDEDGQLGQNRAELMTRFTQILLNRDRDITPAGAWLAAEVQREVLSALAYEMQQRSGSGSAVETRHVQKIMPTEVQTNPHYPPDKVSPDQVLTLAASANIIEMPVDRSSVRFYHQLLQEYFAARQLLKNDPASLTALWAWPWWLEEDMPLWERPKRSYDPLPPPPQTNWEETTILAAGLAPENDNQLVQILTQVNPVLAGRCLYQGPTEVDQVIRRGVIAALLETIARPEVALRVRIEAGNVLGYLGDPRLGAMATIPAGEFLMGSDDGDENEKPQHPLYLPEYQIGQYPLTNAEYRHFIEAGGYQQQRWWTQAGWAEKENYSWREPRYWRDNRFCKPNQPVVGISWHEAVAYCRWLSAETGLLYRLPTEAEWEKGARGVDGRIYPWGDRFEAGLLNARAGAQQVRATTPVGIYSSGISPFGVFDGAGNVWEWCATKCGDGFKPYPYDVKEDEWSAEYLEYITHYRVLRGGAWDDGQGYARCASRNGDFTDDGYLNIGVRVVCLPQF